MLLFVVCVLERRISAWIPRLGSKWLPSLLPPLSAVGGAPGCVNAFLECSSLMSRHQTLEQIIELCPFYIVIFFEAVEVVEHMVHLK